MARSTASTRPAVLEDETEDTKGDSKATTQLKAKLRNLAERKVLNEHKAEYHRELERLYQQEDLEYKRVLTPEEKDEQALEELLARRPDLRAKIVQEHAPEAETHVGEPDDETHVR